MDADVETQNSILACHHDWYGYLGLLLFKLVAPKELRKLLSRMASARRNPEALRQQQAEELMEKMEVRNISVCSSQYRRGFWRRGDYEEDFDDEEDYGDEEDCKNLLLQHHNQRQDLVENSLRKQEINVMEGFLFVWWKNDFTSKISRS